MPFQHPTPYSTTTASSVAPTASTARPSVGSVSVATPAHVPVTQKVEGVLKNAAGHVIPGLAGQKLKAEGAVLEGKPVVPGSTTTTGGVPVHY